MIVVYYSLVADANGTRERQWARSVESLRQYNPDVIVVLCLYGSARPGTFTTARRADVHVWPMGDYAEAIGDVPWHWRVALATIPTLHKLLCLRGLAEAGSLARIIYLDCDTYFYGDVADLAERYGQCDWYAREEYIDPHALDKIAYLEGLVPIPVYNTGVILLTPHLARTLATLLDDFLWYAWRLLLGACLWSPQIAHDRALVDLVRERSAAGERRLALPYPGDNLWIIEEIATSLVLGRIPGLKHSLLGQTDVAQGDEYATRPPGSILVHYFTSRERDFLAHLDGERFTCRR